MRSKEPRSLNTASKFSRLRLMLLDDHDFILQGQGAVLAQYRDIEVVGAFTRALDLQAALRSETVDVVVMDYCLGPEEVDGLNLIRALRRNHPSVSLLVLSALYDPATVALALRFGAHGFIGKNQPKEVLIAALRKIANGQVYLHQDMDAQLGEHDIPTIAQGFAAQTPGDMEGAVSSAKLSPRELEVMRCCLQGMTVTSISEKYKRSVKTISTQKRSGMSKLGVRTDIELFKLRRQLEPSS
ncbi:response regulator [Pseudomonas sp. nanlin1]|uniref:response regulator n=1 Tax=Pseudomonas sp. nanlin1 TaxID=3040605 RepID=UPI00388ECB6E